MLIAGLALRKDPDASEKLMIHVLALLAVSNGLSILDELDKQTREQVIEKIIEAIPNPGDRFVVKTKLEDDAFLEQLRKVRQAIAA